MELDELSIGQSSAVRIACYGNYRTEDAYMAHPEQASTKRAPSCLRSTHVMREFILERFDRQTLKFSVSANVTSLEHCSPTSGS